MPQPDVTIRAMRSADLPEVVRIQALCYREIVPESAESLADKQRLSPDSCLVAASSEGLLGYLLSLPWTADAPPLLDARIEQLPKATDCLYLHDLAVDPQARGSGLGRWLVQALLEVRSEPVCLIAIQGSQPWWETFGFRQVQCSPALASKLASYGSAAVYMQRDGVSHRC